MLTLMWACVKMTSCHNWLQSLPNLLCNIWMEQSCVMRWCLVGIEYCVTGIQYRNNTFYMQEHRNSTAQCYWNVYSMALALLKKASFQHHRREWNLLSVLLFFASEMSLSHQDLVLACTEVLDTFNPEVCALEEHIENYLDSSRVSWNSYFTEGLQSDCVMLNLFQETYAILVLSWHWDEAGCLNPSL